MYTLENLNLEKGCRLHYTIITNYIVNKYRDGVSEDNKYKADMIVEDIMDILRTKRYIVRAGSAGYYEIKTKKLCEKIQKEISIKILQEY